MDARGGLRSRLDLQKDAKHCRLASFRVLGHRILSAKLDLKMYLYGKTHFDVDEPDPLLRMTIFEGKTKDNANRS